MKLKDRILRAMPAGPFTTEDLTIEVFGTATPRQRAMVCTYLARFRDMGVLQVAGILPSAKGRPAFVWEVRHGSTR